MYWLCLENIVYVIEPLKPEKPKGKENYGIWTKENRLVHMVILIFDYLAVGYVSEQITWNIYLETDFFFVNFLY